MKQKSGFDRIQSILEFIQLKPTLAQLLAHLSEHVCPLGEVAGVSSFELSDEGEVASNGYYGFHKLNTFEYKFPITADRPGAEALRTMEIVIQSKQYVLENYVDFADDFHPTGYQTAVAFPVTTRNLFVCALNSRIEDFPPMREYFECIKSILAFWINLANYSENANKLPKNNEDSKELTERQSVILDLIRDGKTNASIAVALGYSESLIRQESIIIYRKLNVSGRRDLQSNHDMDSTR